MFNTIEEYLNALKTEMKDADPALIQDAQSDAHEHLTTALEAARAAAPETNEAEALAKIIEEYGSPEETASAYKEVERRTSPVLKQEVKLHSWLGRFFGVYIDPRAWGSLFYMLITFITGIFYFIWAVTGLSLSISFLIFIFGFPLALLFLLSVRGLALLEGRLVEALLGIRMPRRPLFSSQSVKWFDRLKSLITDKATWLMLVYMILQLALGIIYFSLILTVVSLCVIFIALPFIQTIWHTPVITLGSKPIFLPMWELILASLTGFLVLTSFMHAVKWIGQLHGRLAKWLLVS